MIRLARVQIRIDAGLIDTHDPRRDAHLRSPEFFDVARHPAISFEATEIERHTLDDYRVTGDLTIRGITRRVVLDVSRRELNQPFAVAGTISRKDFGLTWNAVDDKLTLTAELETMKLPENRQVPAIVAAK